MTELTEKYRQLIYDILVMGQQQDCRNGSQLILPHYSFTINDMKNNHKLLLRKMYYKGIDGEFDTLIDPTPLTNVSQFEANGCNYWKLWAEDDGSINVDYHNKLHPQLEDIISDIQMNPTSRRHIIDLWDHSNVRTDILSLPCCWNQLVFSVINNTLHLTWTQRSVDTMVGLPSDVRLAYRFMKHVADLCDLKVGSCMFSLSNVHIYSEHIHKAKELLNRTEADYNKPLKFELKG